MADRTGESLYDLLQMINDGPTPEQMERLAEVTGADPETVAAWFDRSAEPEQVLDAEAAARLLGVSLQTVYVLMSSGELKARKVGREWRTTSRMIFDYLHDRAGD